jgi:hypothetical protein
MHFRQYIPNVSFRHWFENVYLFYKLFQYFLFVYHIHICNESANENKLLLNDEGVTFC